MRLNLTYHSGGLSYNKSHEMTMICRVFLACLFLFASFTIASDADDSLVRAARKGDVAAIKESLGDGANVNARNEATGWTPLIAAAYYGYPEAAQLLIQSGADVNLFDHHHGSALMKAVTLGSFENREDIVVRKSEIVKLLLQAGADPYARDALGVAVWLMPFTDEVPEFIRIFEDANVKGVKEEELIQAIDAGDLTGAAKLLEKKADVNLPTDEGDTCWTRALMWGRSEMIELLLNHGADVNAQLVGGQTALMLAVTAGNEKLVRELLHAGARADMKNEKGQTALDLALKNGNQQIIQLLNAAAPAASQP
jgi:uncharacterized protein